MTNSYDFKEIEGKWQKSWFDNNIYEAIDLDQTREKKYILTEFPYPSGSNLHVGHVFRYTVPDVFSRYYRMKGYNVMFPIGYDSFGLPTEERARKDGKNPVVTTEENVTQFTKQLKRMGYGFDWSRSFSTTDKDYYKWTQWIFSELFRAGLVVQKEVELWWCPFMSTVLANEEVIDGPDGMKISERGEHPVEKKTMLQWTIRITEYAEKLLEGLNQVDWPEHIKDMQRNWIGKSKGVKVKWRVKKSEVELDTFTTRVDTLPAVSFIALAPESSLIESLCTKKNIKEVEEYIAKTSAKSERERQINKDKSGVFTGSYAINPIANKEVPIYVADYVLAGYGTGVIMGVAGHDERDHEFATALDIDMLKNVSKDGRPNNDMSEADVAHGILYHSGKYNGMTCDEAKVAMTEDLEQTREGVAEINYKFRDWVFSRQRYWGEPFPFEYIKTDYTDVQDEQVLIASHNKAKINRFKKILPDVNWITLEELGLKIDEPKEDGNSELENATIKAKAYYEATGIKSFALDTGFYIEGLSDEDQPAHHSQEVAGVDDSMSQEERFELMKEYYKNIAKEHGGSVQAYFKDVFVIYDGKEIKATQSKRAVTLTDVEAEVHDIYVPMASLYKVPPTNKYLHQLTELEYEDFTKPGLIRAKHRLLEDQDKLDYLIFDFDGVIGDTFEETVKYNYKKYQAGEHVILKDKGKLSLEEFKELFLSYFDSPKHSRDKNIDKNESDSIVGVVKDIWEELIQNQDIKIFSEFFDEITQIPNARLAIVTSGYAKLIAKLIVREGKNPHIFDYILGIEHDISKENKIDTIAANWEVSLSNIKYFTDTKSDIIELDKFLDNANVFGTAWGWHGEKKLLELIPEHQLLREFKDIHKVVHNNTYTVVDGQKYLVKLIEPENLPLVLPPVEDYEPSNDGRSPLAKTDWINIKDENGEIIGKHESDTMPNWAGSSWYFLRYCDPHNDQEFASKEKLDYWLPVDHYFGGSEHTTLHLLYSRFWHRFLHDYNYIDTPEPYQMRTNGGILLAEDNTKMSKSKGNVINPDEKIAKVGADALRVYINFIGPYDATVAWQENGLMACKKFLESVWSGQEKVHKDYIDDDTVVTLLNKTIKEVEENLVNLKSNVSVAKLMELNNLLKSQEKISQHTYNTLLQLLAPIAPHFADELWHQLNNLDESKPSNSIHLTSWPEFDESKLISSTVTIAVQINGKIRAEIEVPRDELDQIVLEKAIESVGKHLEGKNIEFSKVIPNKLVTIAAK